MKKIIALIIGMLLCTSNAYAMTKTEIVNNLNSLKNKYYNGSEWCGTYYANDGSAGPWQCFGFACEIFRGTFGCEMPRAYTADMWHFANTNNVVCVGSIASPTENQVKNLLSKARPGDVLQARGGTQHTMVITNASDVGINVFDANYDNHNTVRVDAYLSHGTVASKYYVGLSLYRYNQYPNDDIPDQPQNCQAGSWDDRVQIQWDRVGNADYYECGLIDVNTRNIVLKEDVNDWYYNFYNVPEGQYFAYVCAHNSAGTSLHSGWQRVDVSYTVPNAPNIKVNVEKTVEGNNVQVSWEAVNGANRYEYYLSEFPVGYAYTTNTKKGTTSDTSVTFSDLKNGHYEMFIHAISGLGKVSPQSNWIIFDVYAKDYVPVKTISFNGNIYALYDYEMSWSFAKDLCEDFGGHLVTITSKEENKAITDLLEYGSKNSYWLGASDYGRNEKDYAWITGEKFSYNNWMDNEPNNAGTDGEREHFAEVRKSYGNKWNDVNNINKENKGFILEIETKNIKATSTKTFNGSTYMIFDNNATWTEAKYICEMYGGNLAIVDSDEEKEFIKDFIDAGKRNWYYIGAKKQNNSWNWVDGTEVKHIDWREDALKWDGNFLMMYRSSKNCVGFNNAYFPEEDIKHIGFICEINSQIPNCNTTISLSDKYYLSAEIHDLQKNAVYAAGLYDSSDRLLEIKSINVGSEDNTCELSLSKNSEAAYVKTFLWNDLLGMNPLTESEIIKI